MAQRYNDTSRSCGYIRIVCGYWSRVGGSRRLEGDGECCTECAEDHDRLVERTSGRGTAAERIGASVSSSESAHSSTGARAGARCYGTGDSASGLASVCDAQPKKMKLAEATPNKEREPAHVVGTAEATAEAEAMAEAAAEAMDEAAADADAMTLEAAAPERQEVSLLGWTTICQAEGKNQRLVEIVRRGTELTSPLQASSEEPSSSESITFVPAARLTFQVMERPLWSPRSALIQAVRISFKSLSEFRWRLTENRHRDQHLGQ